MTRPPTTRGMEEKKARESTEPRNAIEKERGCPSWGDKKKGEKGDELPHIVAETVSGSKARQGSKNAIPEAPNLEAA